MKILLINPPIREHALPYELPIGLGIIANVLLGDGHEVKVLDINAERLSQPEVCERVSLQSYYDIIGVGGLITTYKYLKWLIPELKKRNPNSKIVVGGGVVIENPDLLISRVPADIAVIGEGEITMKELASVLESGGSLEKINGLVYKEKGRLIRTPPRPLISDLDSLPFPAWDLFPMDIYLYNVVCASTLGKKTETNILAARGCPYGCKFCWHMFGRGARFRSVDNVVEEIKLLIRKYNVEAIHMIDETFTLSKKRVMEFCDRLIQEKIDIAWSSLARVNLVDEEMLKKMKQAGCFRVGYGIESGSQRILDRMNKGITTKQAERAIKLTRRIGLEVGATFMLGYPGEDLTTIKETVDFCQGLMLTPTALFYTTPYPGTDLYEEVKSQVIRRYGEEEKFIETLGDAYDFTINLTDFSDEDLVRLGEETRAKLRKIPFYKYLRLAWIEYKRSGIIGLMWSIKDHFVSKKVAPSSPPE